MFVKLVFTFAIILFIYLAIKIKISQQQKRSNAIRIPDEIKLSPFSKAVAELVAIAGGIYISLSMLTSFLNLAVPEQVKIGESLLVDPLAMLALVVTIVQPLFFKFAEKIKIL